MAATESQGPNLPQTYKVVRNVSQGIPDPETHELGADTVQDVNDFPMPRVGANQLLVKVVAASANPVDYKFHKSPGSGARGFRDAAGVLGRDIAGVVMRVGTDVTGYQVGDEVMGYVVSLKPPGASNGAYAEYVAILADWCCKKPDSLSFTDAAGMPLVVFTAMEAVAKARLVPEANPSVLVVGASGGVGTLLVQILAHDLGSTARIFVTAGSENSKQYCMEALKIPDENIVMYRNVEVEVEEKDDEATKAKKRIDALIGVAQGMNGGQGFDASFDLVGIHGMKEFAFGAMKVSGNGVTIVEGGSEAAFESCFYLNANVGFVFSLAVGWRGTAEQQRIYTDLLTRATRLVQEGAINAPKVKILKGLSSENVLAAHNELIRGGVTGKIVIEVSDP